ncbi:LINE-1 reverse transcriptase-like [Symbiodinium microadriaticum]|uniref:LINE-1 reverse transcriptase-like n=1 Tax=Symbiodinium microadriaticum TaxID=2951 RepID=A0A1Q9C187_SYMMI
MLHCISWNAGGLNAGLYQELIAWLEVQNKYQVCVVQETHWSASSEYFSGKWVCVHSAPAPADATTDRYAGLLILLSRAYFQDPAVHEVIGGRVVHVRAKPKHSDVSLDIVATYQHVWRSQLSTQENSRLRDSVWDALDATLCSLPSRNILFACGDYNTNLRPQPPHVGNAVGPVTSASKLDSRLPQLLERHDLCALNSWHARPLHTYYGHTGYSQIDYIITRRNTATGTSRQARPLHQFPVAGWRLAGHLPIEAQLPMLPVHWRPGRPQHSTQPVDKARLLEAATSCNEDAMALRALVAAKLQDLPVTDPHALHTRVNQILQQCVRQAFPPPQAADGRVSAQAPFRASAKHTWHLYALLRRPRVATIAAMLHKWKLHLAFARASRALRQQSKDLKRAAFAGKLMQAEEAAQRGDQRTLFQIVRSLTPSPGRAFSRLRDDEGRLLSKRAEVLALVEQGQATYAQHDDRPLSESLPEALVLTDAEITVQLEATKAAKAVPSHLAPAAAWKLCASLLGPIFGTSFRHHFAQGSSGHLHGDLADAQMIMLPKVGKSPHVLGNLRPIGLMGPPSKALAGALRDRMLEQLTQLVTQRPQFAYTAGRGTLNALLRIHMHVAEANTLLRSQHISRFGMHAGRRPLPLAGALSLSLDLSRAFDLADRCSIYCTLEKYQVPRAVIDVVQRLHTGAQFVYQAGAHTAAFVPTNGLKQGCKVAPCLWVWYTVALFDTLEERLSEAWVRHTPTMFADDCWAHWIIKSSSDLQRALKELQILLCTLEDYRMRINFSKTAILLKLVGKQAHQALRDCTRLKQGVPHLVVSVHGRTQLIPIKTEHEYLGSKVSYHNVADRNLDHRLQAGQLRYHSIQTSLTGRHAITQAHRIRLWAACVFTSTAYSLAAVGVTAQGLQKWETRALKHLRAIMRKPAHLTRVTNAAIWQQAGLRRPGEQLLDQIQQARAKLEIKARLAPDITTDAGVLRYLYQHEVHLRLLLQREQAVFLTLHALHIHCGIKHPNSTEEVELRAELQPPTQPPLASQEPQMQNLYCQQQAARDAERPSHGSDTLKTLTKVIIRQEDQLAELRGDKGFCLFLREDPEVSIIPALIQISKAADWMNQAEEWTYFKWNHQEKKLVRDADKEAIAQPALLEKVDYLLANLRGDVVQKFTSRPRIYEMENTNATTAIFFLSISLRGPVAQQVHEHLVQMIGVSALMLVGASLKRELPRRAAIVQQLAEAVFHCRFDRGVNMEQPYYLTFG